MVIAALEALGKIEVVLLVSTTSKLARVTEEVVLGVATLLVTASEFLQVWQENLLNDVMGAGSSSSTKGRMGWDR